LIEAKLMELYDGEFNITENDEAKIVKITCHDDGEENDMISAEIRVWITRGVENGESLHEVC